MASKLIMLTLMCCFMAAAINAKQDCQVCQCQFIGDPVCGRDGKWYDNQCEMECNGVKWNYDHCCGPKPGPPLFLGLPQPAVDEDSLKKCKQIENLCKCPYIMQPVCGRNGKWYNNECVMKCYGIKQADPECCTSSRPDGGIQLF